MTYGEVRSRITKLCPEIPDLDLIDGWIADRYQSILDRLDWQRRNVATILQTTAPYNTGTPEGLSRFHVRERSDFGTFVLHYAPHDRQMARRGSRWPETRT